MDAPEIEMLRYKQPITVYRICDTESGCQYRIWRTLRGWQYRIGWSESYLSTVNTHSVCSMFTYRLLLPARLVI